MVVTTRRVVVSVLILSALAVSGWLAPHAGAATFGRDRAGGKTVVGSGQLRTESRKVRDFYALTLIAPTEVRIVQGDKESLTITAEDNLLPLITTEVRRGELRIDFDMHSVDTIRTTKPIKVDLMVRELSAISIAGSGDVESPGLRAKTFSLSIPGAGSVKLNLEADKARLGILGSGKADLRLHTGELQVSIAGAGSCRLTGTADRLWVDIPGSGECSAAGLTSGEAHVTVAGSGEVEVRANKTLDASIAGSGTIRYAGDATVTQHVAGSGSVRRLPGSAG